MRRYPFARCMEMRDVFLRDGTFIGRSIEKHEPMQKGWYLKHVIIILKTEDDGYIMQQRALKAKHSPGMWDVTGGGVFSGETSARAAVREAYEELGVEVDEKKLVHMLREVTEWGEDYGVICDTYAVRVKPPARFTIAGREVNDVKIAAFEEFIETVTYNKTPAFRAILERVEAEL